MRSTEYTSGRNGKRNITIELTNDELQMICNTFFYAAEDLESFPYKENYQFCELRADLYGILCFVNSGVIPRNDGALEELQAKVIELWKKEHEKK